MCEGLIAALGQLPAQLRRTLTWDQGKELAMHQQISEQTGTRVFFCDAHSPSERGSNENMNGNPSAAPPLHPSNVRLRQFRHAR
jgi:transposase, IS30 family